jgi:hypothetical protein
MVAFQSCWVIGSDNQSLECPAFFVSEVRQIWSRTPFFLRQLQHRCRSTAGDTRQVRMPRGTGLQHPENAFQAIAVRRSTYLCVFSDPAARSQSLHCTSINGFCHFVVVEAQRSTYLNCRYLL